MPRKRIVQAAASRAQRPCRLGRLADGRALLHRSRGECGSCRTLNPPRFQAAPACTYRRTRRSSVFRRKSCSESPTNRVVRAAYRQPSTGTESSRSGAVRPFQPPLRCRPPRNSWTSTYGGPWTSTETFTGRPRLPRRCVLTMPQSTSKQTPAADAPTAASPSRPRAPSDDDRQGAHDQTPRSPTSTPHARRGRAGRRRLRFGAALPLRTRDHGDAILAEVTRPAR